MIKKIKIEFVKQKRKIFRWDFLAFFISLIFFDCHRAGAPLGAKKGSSLLIFRGTFFVKIKVF